MSLHRAGRVRYPTLVRGPRLAPRVASSLCGFMPPHRRTILKLLLASTSVLFCVFALELAVRALSTGDVDGQRRFRSTRLKPYRIPVKRVEQDIAAYRATERTALIYDRELGWSQRPAVSDHNAAGFITTGPTPERARPSDRLRIALFGDSFTQGNYRTGWWRLLEEQLNAAGVKCEVLNFGVGGYGMDQAYLRWKRDGAPWQPHVVVFGFFAEDCYRNVNLLRLLRDPDSGIPFMKPRFVVEGEGLRLVNSPTPEPQAVPAILREFDAWPLAAHEHFYRPADFQMNAWRWCRLAALVEAKTSQARGAARAEEFFRIDGEAAQIALRIVRKMRVEVEAAGAKFYVAHLPGEIEITSLRQSGRMRHEQLYAAVKAENTVIPLEPALLETAQGRDLSDFFGDGHYRADFNAVSARVIAEFLQREKARGAGGE